MAFCSASDCAYSYRFFSNVVYCLRLSSVTFVQLALTIRQIYMPHFVRRGLWPSGKKGIWRKEFDPSANLHLATKGSID